MSDQRVEEIRGRFEGGLRPDEEWRVEEYEDETGETIYYVIASTEGFDNILISDHLDEDTARFLAHAPSDIAYLLARLEAAEAVVEAARDSWKELTHGPTANIEYVEDRLRTALEEYGEVKGG